MIDTVVRRYAQALYEEAAREDAVEKVDADVALIRDTLAESRDLQLFFQSPVISREKKSAVVEKLFTGKVSPVTLRLLRLLVEKNREDRFPSVVEAYLALRDEKQGIVEAEARMAYVPSADELGQLEQALAAKTGKQVRLRVTQDESLLGVVVVRLGDTVYDGSVRHQLDVLRDKMEAGQYAGLN